MEIIEILKNSASKLCADNESICFMQKLIGDYYRYAYESTQIERYVPPEVQGEAELESATKITDKDSVDATNDG